MLAHVYALDGSTLGDMISEIAIDSSEDVKKESEVTIPEGVESVRILITKAKGIAYVDDVFFNTTSEEVVTLVDPKTPTDALPVNAAIGNNWLLNFSDEFKSAKIDARKWNVENSTRSRGSRTNIGVDEWYWRPYNVEMDGDNLLLHVKKEGEAKMTCGAVQSMNKYSARYGYFEARMKIAETSKGSHTAFWLMPTSKHEIPGTGADGAEIDIVETAYVNNKAQSVIHIDGYGEMHQQNGIIYDTPNIHDGNYHLFGMWWTPEFIRTYYDGRLVAEFTDPKWISKVASYLYLSDGANFGESGDQYFVNREIGALTKASIDYVRVWKQK